MCNCVLFVFLTGLSKRGNINEALSERYARENVLLGLLKSYVLRTATMLFFALNT